MLTKQNVAFLKARKSLGFKNLWSLQSLDKKILIYPHWIHSSTAQKIPTVRVCAMTKMRNNVTSSRSSLWFLMKQRKKKLETSFVKSLLKTTSWLIWMNSSGQPDTLISVLVLFNLPSPDFICWTHERQYSYIVEV